MLATAVELPTIKNSVVCESVSSVSSNKRYHEWAFGEEELGLTECREGSMLCVRRVEKPIRNSNVDLAPSICWSQDTNGRSRSTERLCEVSQ